MPVGLNAEMGSGHNSAYYEDRLHVIFPQRSRSASISRVWWAKAKRRYAGAIGVVPAQTVRAYTLLG
jgi:hypothetical protein